jgi:hypothetical protein
MSHIHHLAGSTNAAAEYQDYLEKLRARKAPLRTFDSAIETEHEAEGRDQGQPQTDGQDEAEPNPNPDPAPEGKRYA